eukprot:8856546-Pyramimonas_sp.AAC.1
MGRAGSLWGRLGAVLGASCAVLDATKTKEASMQKVERDGAIFASWRSPLGASWGVLEPFGLS